MTSWTYLWYLLNSDYRTQQTLKWIATAFMLLGAVFISIYPDIAATIWPFVLFFTGHVMWGLFAYIMKENSLFWLNVGFLPLDVYAIYLRL